MRKPTPTDRESIRSSAEFRAWMEDYAREAQRKRDDLMQAVEGKRGDIARSQQDFESYRLKTELEIANLLDEVADMDEITSAADRALTLRLTPRLTPNSIVADALGDET